MPSEQARETAPTSVVTAFVVKREGGQDYVLLVRRSQRVRTYKGAWGGISGYLESGVTPREQVYTELREEANLGPDDVRLLAAGQPLPVDDSDANLHWVVYPFLFALDHPEQLRTDWEAEEAEWVEPRELRERTTVPKLAEAFDEVYPPRGQDGTS